MATKTCKQSRISTRTGRIVTRYLPHVLPDGATGGYARCSECGTDHYVGEPTVPAGLASFVAPIDTWKAHGYRVRAL
jgi:hypothetical protein